MIDDDLSAADPLGQIADEFVEAFRQGRRPSVEEFARRYPQHASEIREMLPALVLMEQAKSADDTSGQRRQAKASASAAPLRQLGDYQILREVGRGGMGVVYEAQQLSLGRHVAIKVLPSHALLDPRQLGRFQREARSAARLHHTNIVPVFGIGEQDGLHYYVMQFIPGLGLDVVLDELRRLRQPRGKQAPTQADASGRLTNVTRHMSAANVARGLLSGTFTASGGPQKDEGGRMKDEKEKTSDPDSSFILHPSSFSSATIHLPGQKDASTLSESGNQYWQSVARVGVQVADALAHAASQGVLHRDIKPSNLMLDDTGNVWVTDFGLAKADTDGDNLTHTGDVIGTLRYMAPERFNGQGDLRSDVYSLGLTLYELLALRPAFDDADRNKLVKQMLHDEPVRPRKLNPGVPRDLETVVLKAIARDPAHRYQTAAELRGDLQRFLEDKPIHARRTRALERGWRWCRRNPVIASLCAVVLLLLVMVAVGSSLAAWRIAAARTDEERQHQRAEAQARLRHEELVRLQVATGARLMDEGDLFASLAWFTEALRLDAGTPAEAMHRTRLAAVLHQCPKLTQLWPHQAPVTHAVFSPDGRRVLTTSHDRTARIWDLATGQALTPPLEHGDKVYHAAFSGDGRLVATTSDDGTARIWDARTGRPITGPLRHAQAVWHVAFSPDQRRVVTASHDRTARVWDAATGAPLLPALQHDDIVWLAEFSPDGRSLLTTSGAFAQVWDSATGAPRFSRFQHSATVEWGEFRRDGRQILTAGGNTVQFWDSATGQPAAAPLRLNSAVKHAAFSPDGTRVATAMGEMAQVWEVATGRMVTPPLKHQAGVWFVSFDHAGRRVATVSGDTARVWDADTGEPLTPILKHNGLAFRGTFSPDGRYLLSAGGEAACLWDIELPSPSSVSLKGRPTLHFAAFSPDGRSVVSIEPEASRIWDTTTGEPLPVPHQKPAHRAAWSPANDRIVLAGPSDSAQVWEVASGKTEGIVVRHRQDVNDAVFSPDGASVLTASDDGTVRVWDASTGRPLQPSLQHEDGVGRAAFSPDGRAAVTVGFQWSAQVWDLATGQLRTGLMKHSAPIRHVAFSPNGRWLLTASDDRTARLWDASTGEPLTPPLRHTGGIRRAAFSADSRLVATAGTDGGVRVWDTATGSVLTPVLKHGCEVLDVWFSPEDDHILAISADTKIRRWQLNLRADSRPVDDLILLARLLDGHQLDGSGGVVPLDAAALAQAWQQLRPQR
jgi:WD40 repeat protein/serine/threonine protein kinase